MPSSRGSFRPRDGIRVSCISWTAGRFFTYWASWEAWALVRTPPGPRASWCEDGDWAHGNPSHSPRQWQAGSLSLQHVGKELGGLRILTTNLAFQVTWRYVKVGGQNLSNVMLCGLPDGSVVRYLPAKQDTRVQSLIQEDSTCHGATKTVCHNYWECALEPRSCDYRAQVLQLLKLTHPKARALQQDKPPQREAQALQRERSPRLTQREKSPRTATKTQCSL